MLQPTPPHRPDPVEPEPPSQPWWASVLAALLIGAGFLITLLAILAVVLGLLALLNWLAGFLPWA